MTDNLQFDCGTFRDGGTPTDRFEYNARFPEYGRLSDRLASFDGANTNVVICERQLADAGFFYTGRRGIVQCFYCGVRLAEWVENEIPWKTHVAYVLEGGCGYMDHMKGKQFVQSQGQIASACHSCFKVRGSGEWVPCKLMTECVLCNWEFWMTPSDDETS